MKEQFYDALLNVKTVGDQRGFNQSVHYYRYEPTPYSALETLFSDYVLNSNDRIVDFGCGKGRLNFYINYLFNVSVVGVEMNEAFYQEAVNNRTSYLKKMKKSEGKIHFQCCLAQDYEIDPLDNRFYFFNPFSIQIFMTIINNILLSVEKSEREIELILYYGSDDYIFFLENHPSFELKEEVKLPDLYEYNPYERFLIYRLVY
ncbi:methyltransferase [Lederbergia citrea]|uniref:Methyltransferase n=1 Tax=Lederbergia citrea TaxID=2833581 RepID=A0A942UPI4_9BACI|nr:methyltransferase [Lederbergia citrea]MBS4179417.1 methyltransferase [Lederbergia citrea]MBS4206086.1 methyltransferase [Lederbergia citrea]MBS4224465.1 methyltransferase [Lederbergia citrea]